MKKPRGRDHFHGGGRNVKILEMLRNVKFRECSFFKLKVKGACNFTQSESVPPAPSLSLIPGDSFISALIMSLYSE